MKNDKGSPFIIIVNYRFRLSQQVISDLLDNKFSVVIWDNTDSRFGKPRNIQVIHNKFWFFKSRKNIGFAAGINRGIRFALQKRATHIILLNPDVTASPATLRKLLECKFDIASPILKFRKENGYLYDLGGCLNRILGRPYHIESTNTDHNADHIDFVSGACMRIKIGVIKKNGFFDEKYFLYFEDVDYCIRAKEVGFTIGVCKDLLVSHEVAGTSKKYTRLRHINLLKSNIIFINDRIKTVFKPVAYCYWMLLALKTTVALLIDPE